MGLGFKKNPFIKWGGFGFRGQGSGVKKLAPYPTYCHSYTRMMEPTYAGFKNKYAYIGFKNKYAYTGLGMCTQKPKGDYVVSSLRTQA